MVFAIRNAPDNASRCQFAMHFANPVAVSIWFSLKYEYRKSYSSNSAFSPSFQISYRRNPKSI